MREIKFRAWNGIDNKIVDWSTFKANPCFLMSIIKGVKHYELMQYTGLKDKNGVDIYEGDIVMCYPDEIELCYTKLVEWDNESHELGITTNGRSGATLCKNNQDILLVIGNIHQNTGLLK